MNRISYEGTTYNEQMSEFEDVRVTVCSVMYGGNVEGLAMMLLRELIKFNKLDKPDVFSLRMDNVQTALFFTKSKTEDSLEERMSMYISIIEALQDYLDAYMSKEMLSSSAWLSYVEALSRVSELFLTSTINSGGLFNHE